ncbi:GNAT family N-acetyltransferase [Streptomyces sp. NPDC052052]|uniref:GNAT family N-acetyltransferase n=1 Tax=Streptomyces sp. NPDC052052 TaxID=3154756 RepID=UPI00343C5270
MPYLVDPLMSPGCLSQQTQPALSAGSGLVLRPWLPKDAARVVEVFRDPAIQRWNLRRADSEEEAREWIKQWQQGWEEETAAHWAVVDGTRDTALGRVSLQHLILMSGQAKISYWTAPSVRGAGIGPRAVATVAEWALGEAGFHRIELGHSTTNEASCRVAVKAGFALEGVRRKALLHADGLHDMHLHARIR